MGDTARAESSLAAYLETDLVPAGERAQLESRLAGLRARIAEEEEAERLRRDEAAAAADRAADAEERAARAEREAAQAAPRVSPGAAVSFVVGGVGLAGFAVFAGLAKREDGLVASECGEDVGRYCSDAQVRSLRTYGITADITLGVGVAGIATGLILYFVQRPDEDVDDGGATVSLSPVVGRDVGLQLSGTF